MTDEPDTPAPQEPTVETSPVPTRRQRRRLPLVIASIAALVVLADGALAWHQASTRNTTTLAATAKGVTTVRAHEASFRASRHYVGTVQPWLEARVGPQLTSAYVDTVLVRPGDVVKKGAVLATLDCRNASAESSAVQARARALAAEQEALAHRADRMGGLVDEGFVSKDEAETQRAQSDSKASELVSTRAKLQRATLEVDDCVLRAPFDGEIAARPADPGMFVRPGSTVVVVVQRNAVRVAAEVPETDFALVPRKTRVEVHMLATGLDKVATVSRRAPAADPGTRTVHIELDLDNADHGIPVGTTAELRVDVGEALGATEVPLLGAIVKGERATVWLIDKQTAHKVTARVIGERAGSVFVDAAVVPTGAHVVTEGRGLLREGDKVDAMPDEKHDEKHEVQP